MGLGGGGSGGLGGGGGVAGAPITGARTPFLAHAAARARDRALAAERAALAAAALRSLEGAGEEGLVGALQQIVATGLVVVNTEDRGPCLVVSGGGLPVGREVPWPVDLDEVAAEGS